MHYFGGPILPGQCMVSFRVENGMTFDLSEAAKRLSKEVKHINYKYGTGSFVGPDFSFCIYYNHRSGRIVLAWYYIIHAFRLLFCRFD